MYTLSIVSMFKNESWILAEWFEHYIRQGVDHFYLIDNGSTDVYSYPSDKVTLIQDGTRYPKNTQDRLIHQHFLEKIKAETEWILVCDVDEYVYARLSYRTIPSVLKDLMPEVEKVWIPWKVFGSNGHVHQPPCIVDAFTLRHPAQHHAILYTRPPIHQYGTGKMITRTKTLRNIFNHETITENPVVYTIHGIPYSMLSDPSTYPLQLNHYMLMSKDYYKRIKCVRGGGQLGHVYKYSMEYFEDMDKQCTILDTELKYMK